MVKNFCDLCGKELKGPAPRECKGQYTVIGAGIAAQNPSYRAPTLLVDIKFTGEYCDPCKEQIIGGMQLDFVLARGLSRAFGGGK